MEKIIQDKFVISDEKKLLKIDEVRHILKNAYWCKGITKEVLQSAINGSLCFGVYFEERQIAFARIVTDGATFGWLCDVIVHEAFRGKGISKELMRFIVDHPKTQGLRRFCLATKDAHKLYEQFNFKLTETPQNWMEIKNNKIYAE